MAAAGIVMRAADARDRFLVTGWLGSKAQAELWTGSRSAMAAAVSLALTSSTSNARIFESDGKPWAYIHALEQPIDPHHARGRLPAGTLWIDAVTLIPPRAQDQLLPRMLEMFVGEVFATTLTPALGAIVPLAKETIVRIMEQAGFDWCAVTNDACNGVAWLLMRERP